MDAKIDREAKTITFTLPLFEPRQSSTGKTILVGQYSGGVGEVIDDKQVFVSISVFLKIPKPPKAAKGKD